MGALLVLLVRRLRRPVWQRLLAALALFWLFVWLSPQIYYGYYLLIFDGLPIQSVIKLPPGPGHMVRLLTFTEEASLSRHGQGLLGWLLIASALWRAGPFARSSPSGERS